MKQSDIDVSRDDLNIRQSPLKGLLLDIESLRGRVRECQDFGVRVSSRHKKRE
jgi:hypothetical protein